MYIYIDMCPYFYNVYYIYLSIYTCVMVKMAPWITTVVAMFFPSVFPHFDNI